MPSARRIDLNADLGEGVGQDAALYPLISSASIACGGHAGDAASMRAALRACRANDVVAGAHPGFPDRANFGRRRLDMKPGEMAASVCAQIAALIAIGAEEDVPIRYVKLHGALANMASEDEVLARAVFELIRQRFPALAILAMEATAQDRIAREVGAQVIAEAYADRAYTPDGQLVSRSIPGAVIETADAVARCRHLVLAQEIIAVDGTRLPARAGSICLHGDTAHALELARAVRDDLGEIALIVSPLRRP